MEGVYHDHIQSEQHDLQGRPGEKGIHDNRRLKDELDEFLRWFGYNMPGMKERDAVRGWNLIAELKSILENRGVDMTEYMHVDRSEEHTSELQSPDCISYAVFGL